MVRLQYKKMVNSLYVAISILYLTKAVDCVNYDGSNVSSTNILSCPTWMYRINESSQHCVCGVNLTTSVICDASLQQVKVRGCHMITFDSSLNQTYAGYSFYRCVKYFSKISTIYFPVPSDASQVNLKMCDQFKRGGLFCGACKANYSPLVYSYKLNCKKCSERENRQSIFIFIIIAFFPVSVFYAIVLLFKFNVNSPSLHGFVLIAQLLTQMSTMKILYAKFDSSYGFVKAAVVVFETLYSVWNLNFFRAFTPDICLRISTLSALSLEYVVAFYPMLLIVVTYIGTELHSRGVKVIIAVWRPFQRCSMYFRKEWNIQSSLVDVFATFLLLSYNRLLDINFSLLMYTTPYNPKGELVGRYLYYDSSKKFFGEDHRLFGILAVLILILFNFLPFLLLLLYPMKWFQQCLNHIRLNKIALHAFVDKFIGCYKDGTEPGTRDCRYFAALFFLLRFANCVSTFWTFDGYYLVVFPIILVCFSTIFISAQPYRSKFSQHNITTVVFLMIGIIICSCYFGIYFTATSCPEYLSSLLIFTICILSLPLIYVACLILKWIYDRIPGHYLCYPTSRYALLGSKVTNSNIMDSTVHCKYNSI